MLETHEVCKIGTAVTVLSLKGIRTTARAKVRALEARNIDAVVQ